MYEESLSDSDNDNHYLRNEVRDRSPNRIILAQQAVEEFLNEGIVEDRELENLIMAEQNLQSFHLQTIPKFDGERTTLPVFLKNCEAFISTYVDNANPQNPRNAWILRSILSRLEGRAMALVGSREDANSWFNIKRLLLQYFSDQRSLDCLLRELMYLKKDSRESLHEFGIRVQDMHNQLSTKLRLSDLDENLKLVKESDYETVALNTYLHGLPEHLSLSVRIQKPENVPEAMSLVQNEENFHMLSKDYRMHGTSSKPHFSNNFGRNKQNNFSNTNRYHNYSHSTPNFTPFTPFRPQHFSQNYHAPRPTFNNSYSRPFNNFGNNMQQNTFNRPTSFQNRSNNVFQPRNQPNTYKPTPMETSTRNMTRVTQRPNFQQQPRRNNLVFEEIYHHEVGNTENMTPRRQNTEHFSQDCGNSNQNFCEDLNFDEQT